VPAPSRGGYPWTRKVMRKGPSDLGWAAGAGGSVAIVVAIV